MEDVNHLETSNVTVFTNIDSITQTYNGEKPLTNKDRYTEIFFDIAVRFVGKHSLQNMKSSHTKKYTIGEKTFHCEICGKYFV